MSPNFIKFRLNETQICPSEGQKVIECLEVRDKCNINVGFQQMLWDVVGWA